MAVACCCPRKLGAAVGAHRLGRLPGLFALVPQQIAKGRELPSVAPVLPALRLGPALDDTHTRRAGTADDAALVRVMVAAGAVVGVGVRWQRRRRLVGVGTAVVWRAVLGLVVCELLGQGQLMCRLLVVVRDVVGAHHGRR